MPQSPKSINIEPKKMKNMKQLLLQQSSSALQLIMITFLFTTTLAQSPTTAPAPFVPTPPVPALPGPASSIPTPPVPGPSSSTPLVSAPPGPTNISAILEKAGRFNIFIRLLKSTNIGDQLNSAINKTNQDVTLFAPSDNAFSHLPSGTSLNSFTGQQQIKLVQFHVLYMYVPLIQFQTLSNPVPTQAGNSNYGQFPLNVLTSGRNVSITTGIVNATVVNTIYSDGQLAVYEVDQVLLPMQFYVSPPPTPAPSPAPAPSKPKKKSSPPSTSVVVPSSAVRTTRYIGISFAVAVVAVIAL